MTSVQEARPDSIGEGALRFADRVRSPGDLERLSRFDQKIYLPLLLSALLPIVTAVSRASDDSGISIAINVTAWLVFVFDLAVRMRLIRHYLRTGYGIFDLVVVILTAPWFLIPGLGGSQVLVLARLARLVRLMFVSKAARRVGRQLGKVGIFSVGMLTFCAWVAFVAEQPVNNDFATFWDAMWWGIVTLTTVGYGDIVPITEQGRLAGTFLMLTGIATLGLISGTLASAFRLAPSEVAAEAEGRAAPEPDPSPGQDPEPTPRPGAALVSSTAPGGPPADVGPSDPSALVAQLATIRAELDAIEQALTGRAATAPAEALAEPPEPTTA